jgi:class 3 adenylate cyclase
MSVSRPTCGNWSTRRSKEHRGRIVKNTGDGFLAEFASVVDAARRAVEVQGALPSAMRLSRRKSAYVPLRD